MKVSIVGSLRDREVACSASDRQGSNFESCVWRTVSSQSSHHPQEVLLAQFSLYVHKGGLKPDSFHFISFTDSNLLPQIPRVFFSDVSLTLSCLNLPLSSSFTTSRELLSQFSTCAVVVDENNLMWVKNCHVDLLVNQFHGNFLSITLSCR